MSNGGQHWTPAPLHGRDDLHEFLFVVVEEQIDDTLGLVASGWPRAGEDGFPRFPEPSVQFRPSPIEVREGPIAIDDTGDFELTVERGELEEIVSHRQVPAATAREGQLDDRVLEELRERSIAVGDAFAMRPNPASNIPGIRFVEVIDITAEAREAAKAAMYAALTPPLDEGVAYELMETEDAGGELA